MALEIKSSVFNNNGYIPEKFTCEGDDISPPLSWSGASEGTKSFVLINDDPDAPMGVWVHWVIYNLPANISGLSENIPKTATLENGTRQGITDFGRVGYGGPCPPPGKPHRYFFKLYAIDRILELDAGLTKEEVLAAIKGHILAKAELIGLYKR